MKNIFILLCCIALLLSYSCNEDDDAIYIRNKFGLKAEYVAESYVNFSWNKTQISNQKDFILVRTNHRKDYSFYESIIDYYIERYQNYDSYYDPPYWIPECQTTVISATRMNYEKRIYYASETYHYYYKLLAYNLDGDYLMSNAVYY